MKIRLLWLPLILSTVLVLLSGTLFTSTGRDDTHITVWAAYALAHTGSILNYNGVRLEQSSSLLFVIVLAALERLNLISITDLARVASIFFAVATVLAAYALVRKMLPGKTKSIALSALLLCGTCLYLVYWAYSGMETTLAALAVILVVLLCGNYLTAQTPSMRTFLAAACSIVIMVMVRPETPLLLGAVLAALVVIECARIAWLQSADPTRLRRLLNLCGVFGVSFGALLLFRWWCFGKFFPQPVYVKVGGITLPILVEGLTYLYVHLRLEPLVGVEFAVAMLGSGYLILQAYRKRYTLTPYFWLALLFVPAQFAFVIGSGGDWMEAGRFLVPIMPVVIVLLVATIAQSIKTPRMQMVVLGALIFLQLVTLVDYARFYSVGMPIWSEISLPPQFASNDYGWFEQHNRVNVRDMPLLYYLKPVVDELSRDQTRPLVIMSEQMGMIPFHLVLNGKGNVELIDRVSLTDATFTDCAFVRQHPDRTLDYSETWRYIFANAAALASECNIPLPDVIFDIGDESDMNLLRENNYQILYKQSGLVSSTADILPGRSVEAGEYIAVRQELAARLGQIEQSHFDFDTQTFRSAGQ